MDRTLPRSTDASTPDDEVNPLSVLHALSCLWLVTPISATVSLSLVVVGMTTNQWLHTSEKMPNPSYNGTGEKDYLSKLTVSGLWVFCITNPGDSIYQCNMIDYFSDEVYSPDPNDSSQAIPYTVTRSIVFILLGSIFVIVGYIFCIMGQCMDNKLRYTLLSGVIFIQTGLAMMCGLVMYIAIFKSEVGSKLRPRSQLQPAIFEYYYGYSFMVYVTGVVITEFSGISCVFLYIYRNQYEWQRKQLEYLKKDDFPTPVNSFFDQRSPVVSYPCRRHPQAYISSNIAVRNARSSAVPELNHFSWDQNNIQLCSVHHRQSNSLKDLSIFYDFPPPPPAISYKFAHHLSVNDLRKLNGFPRDITSNTVSTTVDTPFDDYSPSIQQENDFVTIDLDQPGDSDFNLKRGYFFETAALRRTTPV